MRKKLLLAIASLGSLLVVQAQDNTLSYASTHPIDPTDSPSVIVRKAAHVVPTVIS